MIFLFLYSFYLDISYSPVIDCLISCLNSVKEFSMTLFYYTASFGIGFPLYLHTVRTFLIVRPLANSLTPEEYDNINERYSLIAYIEGHKQKYYWWPFFNLVGRIFYSFFSGFNSSFDRKALKMF